MGTLYSGILTLGAKGLLFLMAPLISSISEHEDRPHIASRLEAENILMNYDLLKKFKSEQIYCDCCSSAVTFENLGILLEKNSSLRIWCDDPGCTAKI